MRLVHIMRQKLNYNDLRKAFIVSVVITVIRSYMDFKMASLNVVGSIVFFLILFAVINLSVLSSRGRSTK